MPFGERSGPLRGSQSYHPGLSAKHDGISVVRKPKSAGADARSDCLKCGRNGLAGGVDDVTLKAAEVVELLVTVLNWLGFLEAIIRPFLGASKRGRKRWGEGQCSAAERQRRLEPGPKTTDRRHHRGLRNNLLGQKSGRRTLPRLSRLGFARALRPDRARSGLSL